MRAEQPWVVRTPSQQDRGPTAECAQRGRNGGREVFLPFVVIADRRHLTGAHGPRRPAEIYEYFRYFYSPIFFVPSAVQGTTLGRVMMGACNSLQPNSVTLVREAHDSAKLGSYPPKMRFQSWDARGGAWDARV